MDIGNFSTYYTDYISDQATSSSKLTENLKSADYSNASDEELLEACKQFEAYFLEQIFKEMQKTVDCLKAEESSDPGNNLVDYFKDNAIQELAATSTETQGLGLAQMMYVQMKRNYNL